LIWPVKIILGAFANFLAITAVVKNVSAKILAKASKKLVTAAEINSAF